VGEVSLGERHSTLKLVKEEKHDVKNRKVLEQPKEWFCNTSDRKFRNNAANSFIVHSTETLRTSEKQIKCKAKGKHRAYAHRMPMFE